MVRPAAEADAEAIAAIYAPIVRETPISFEEVAPSAREMRERIAATLKRFPWLVFDDGAVRGYAYASQHRARAAYRWSVDVSAYVDAAARGRGVGMALYRALFAVLEAQGFQTAFAGIGLPNDASVALHRAAGFTPVGIYENVGYKMGRWHSTQWWQRSIGTRSDRPSEPIPFALLTERSAIE